MGSDRHRLTVPPVTQDLVASARATLGRAGVPGLGSVPQVEPLQLAHDEPPWFALGTATEAALASSDRVLRGAHFTPVGLARSIVSRVVDAETSLVVDPACGAGVFLLAALDRLVACGVPPDEALGRILGRDIDPDSVAMAELACRWWAHGRGVTFDGVDVACADMLLGAVEVRDPVGVVVVGNPPFLDQLDAGSARDLGRRDALRRRLGDRVAAYTDDAALFLAVAAELTGGQGRVAMVLPRSILASRDAEEVRRVVSAQMDLVAVWFDESNTFDAGVRVCVVVLDSGGRNKDRGEVAILSGPSFDTVRRVSAPEGADWAKLLAAAEGVPGVELSGGPRLGEVVEVIAGFRDEYYGLADAVIDHGVFGDAGMPSLVTAGAIDLAMCTWDHRPVRFAKRRWSRPVIDRSRLSEARIASWVTQLLGPKVLVATQTQVLEAVVDETGTMVGSVPVLNVLPHDPEDVWMVAAAIAAPPVTAWALDRRAGTALSVGAVKLSASDIRQIPLPVDRGSWRAGAVAFREAQQAPTEHERLVALRRFGKHMIDAHGAGHDVLRWWSARSGLD